MRILDTDHCIAVLRGQLRLTEVADSAETLGTTAITVGELTHGAYKSARPSANAARVSTFLSYLQILAYDEQCAHVFGKIKAELEDRGMVIGDADLQISSIALRHNATVVTHNQRHFNRVPNLALEDWLSQ